MERGNAPVFFISYLLHVFCDHHSPYSLSERCFKPFTEDILEDMLKETIRQAIEKGLVRNGTIIIDLTHSDAAARPKTVTQVPRELTKQFRREMYKGAYDLSKKFPEKLSIEANLETRIVYT